MLSFRTFARDQKGATAVEFAMVASMLVLTILFIMVVALTLYINQALDFATQKAARQVMTGVVQKTGMSQTAFQAIVCGYLPASVSCSNVIVNLYTVTYGSGPSGYYAFTNAGASGLTIPSLTSGAGSFQAGTQGSYEYLLVIYPITFIPAAFSAILGTATYNGKPAYLAISTAAFKNEQY